MSNSERLIINQRCLQFVQEHLEGEMLEAFKAFENAYTTLSAGEVVRLAELTQVLPSDLVIGYGFGRQLLTVSELDAMMRGENEGCALSKVHVAA